MRSSAGGWACRTISGAPSWAGSFSRIGKKLIPAACAPECAGGSCTIWQRRRAAISWPGPSLRRRGGDLLHEPVQQRLSGLLFPKILSFPKGALLIRPLVFCGERQVAAAASRCQLPVVKSSCPADGSTSRQRTKELIARLEKDYPDLKSKVMGAVERAGIAHWDAV